MGSLSSPQNIVMPSEGYLQTKALLDDPSTLEAAFILGVANARESLPKPLKRKWFIFMKYYLPRLHKADLLGSSQYKECVATLTETKIWAKDFAEEQSDMVEEAEKGASEEMWKEMYVPGMMGDWKWKLSDWKD